MTEEHQPRSTTADAVDPAERIAQYLLQNPSDLIDARQLMRRFHVSVADFQRALQRLDHLFSLREEKAAG
jgi:hypothetical protein